MGGGVAFERLIPARAGNTRPFTAAAVITAAHPRSRGEHSLDLSDDMGKVGSSPLARGTRCAMLRRGR